MIGFEVGVVQAAMVTRNFTKKTSHPGTSMERNPAGTRHIRRV